MDAACKDLDELVVMLKTNPRFTAPVRAAMSESPDPLTACRGLALQVAACYREGDMASALAILDRADSRFTYLPVPLVVLRFGLRLQAGQMERIPSDYLDFGFRAIRVGACELGLEALGAALTADLNLSFALHHEPAIVRRVADAYEQVARHLSSPTIRFGMTNFDGCLRIGMIVPNLVDCTVAYSRRVLHFARFIDRSRFNLSVYCTENLCPRPHDLPVLFASASTRDRAPGLLAELNSLHVPVFIASREEPICKIAVSIARRMAEDGVDILLLQAGVALPIDWLASRLAPVPIKLQIHIGAPALIPELDATLYDNAVNMEREADDWPPFAGRRILMRRGVDLDALDAIDAAPRAAFGLPDDAVLIGVLSNHLDSRLSLPYLDAIGLVIEAQPRAWFVGIGSGNPENALAYFTRRGVAERVRFLPQQREPAAVLKSLDIYANEFPTGGSQSVVEAMACRLPVVAMRCGTTHPESVGADIVGSPWAITSYSPEQYSRQLDEWVRDPAARQNVGLLLRRRAEKDFSVSDYVRRVSDLGETFYRSRRERRTSIYG